MHKNLLIGIALIITIIGGIELIERTAPNEMSGNATTPPSLTAETTLENPSDAQEQVPTTDTAPTAVQQAVPKAPVPSVPVTVPAIPSKAPYVATIYYDGSRFIPETVTIPQGATVLFENASDRLLWVAANPHPSHIRYSLKTPNDCAGSAFDQCKAMKKGETWSFTFSELGDWKYHNHMREVDEGEVIVLSKEKYLKYEKENSQSR